MKKIFVLLISVFIILSICFVPGAAAEIVDSGACGDDLTWTLDSEGTLTISGTGPMTDYSSNTSPFFNKTTIKQIVVEYGATSIGAFSFQACQQLTNITLPNSIETINNDAFIACSQLPEITIPNSVQDIESDAFSSCSALKKIVIPDSVERIGQSAFGNCSGIESIYIGSGAFLVSVLAFFYSTESLRSIEVSPSNQYYHADGNCLIDTADKELFLGCKTSVIPADGSVTKIRFNAFSGCTGLTTLNIPETITSIDEGVFEGCSGIEEINVTVGNSSYNSEGNCLIETATGKLILGCKNSIIPDNGSISSITRRAFYKCPELNSISIPDGTVSIEAQAFYECIDLKSVTFPESLSSIDKFAFYNCYSLENIDVDQRNPYFHSSGDCLIDTESRTLLFGGNKSVIPNDGSVDVIGDYAFLNRKSLLSVNIPDGVTSIGNSAFYQCTGLTTVNIPESVTSIGMSAFYYCTGIETLSIPENVTSIGTYAFCNCSGIKYLSLNSVESIGYRAFFQCYELIRISIPSTLIELSSEAFALCRKLSEVFIYAENAEVDTSAFTVCRALSDVYYTGSEEQWNASDWKAAVPASAAVHYNYRHKFAPELSYTYENDILTITGGDIPAVGSGYPYEWSQFAARCAVVVFGEDVSAIGAGAFADFEALEKIVLTGENVTIEEDAFSGCYHFDTVIAKGHVTCSPGSFDENQVDYADIFSPYPVNGMDGTVYSYAGGTLILNNTSENTAGVEIRNLLDMIAVVSPDFGQINTVSFSGMVIEGVSYVSGSGRNSLDVMPLSGTVTVEVADGEGFAPATFNELNELIAADSEVVFRFVYDDGEEQHDGAVVGVTDDEEDEGLFDRFINVVKSAIAAILGIFSKLMRLVRLLSK